MMKQPVFTFWNNLQQVIPVVQSCTVGDFTLTLVSIEIYAQQGFLLTVIAEMRIPSTLFDRGGRGWTRAKIVDQDGNRYVGIRTTILGDSPRHLFRGRGTFVCFPPLPEHRRSLSITIESIKWEYVERPEEEPSSITLEGPWQFDVSF